jgi:molybdenum cofactor cytidylyltransferase
MTNGEIGIIVLAAGGSLRLGKPKQLLKFEGKTLIRRSTESSLRCKAGPVMVVLGHEHEAVRKEVADLPIEIIVNSDWRSGMSSSVKCAVNKIHERPEVSAVIFTLCDQPRVDHQTLSRLIQTYKSKKAKIVASEYNGTIGVPALFDKSFFEELMSLTGDAGAKSLLRKYSNDIVTIPAPEAAFDIDSSSDYERLVSEAKERDHINGPG